MAPLQHVIMYLNCEVNVCVHVHVRPYIRDVSLFRAISLSDDMCNHWSTIPDVWVLTMHLEIVDHVGSDANILHGFSDESRLKLAGWRCDRT